MENNIQQIIPLADRPGQYGNNVIALALVRDSFGEKQLVYIAHDPVSGRPVIQDEKRHTTKEKGGSHARL